VALCLIYTPTHIEPLLAFWYAVGLIAHGTPIRFAKAFLSSARLSGPLLLQYPLYGGIMSMMKDSGLAVEISKLFVKWLR
jgi:short-chain fatty acids transporter